MSNSRNRIAPTDPTNEHLRVILHLALPLVRSAAEMLSVLPDADSAFEDDDRERFHLLSTIEVLCCKGTLSATASTTRFCTRAGTACSAR